MRGAVEVRDRKCVREGKKEGKGKDERQETTKEQCLLKRAVETWRSKSGNVV